MKLHCCVAAYVSDYAFLGTALLPYPNYRAKFSASLDHAMWFHSTFRSDEWMLYECESPWAGQYVVHFLSALRYICSVCHSTANRPFLLQELSDLSPEPVRSKFWFVFRVSYKPERFRYASQERRVNWLSIYPATDAFTVVCYTLLVLMQLNLI